MTTIEQTSPVRGGPGFLPGRMDRSAADGRRGATRPAGGTQTRASRVWLILPATGLVLLHVVRHGGTIGAVTFAVGSVAAATIACIAITRRRAASTCWRWIAWGLGLTAAGDVISALQTVVAGHVPDVSSADLFWLTGYGAIAVGLALIVPFRDGDGHLDVASVLDLVGLGIVGALVFWQYSIQGTLTDTSRALPARLVWSAYPVFDCAFLVLVVRLLSAGPGRTRTARTPRRRRRVLARRRRRDDRRRSGQPDVLVDGCELDERLVPLCCCRLACPRRRGSGEGLAGMARPPPALATRVGHRSGARTERACRRRCTERKHRRRSALHDRRGPADGTGLRSGVPRGQRR